MGLGGMTNLQRGARRGRGEGSSHEHGYDPESFDLEALPPLPGDPLILPREEHNISRKSIDPDALKIMSRLLRHGHRAFLVGGGVRDLMLGKVPKDFDIGTDARPETIRSLFRNSRIIGRRFRISHIFFTGNKIFEVSTFRATGEDDPDEEGQIRSDNTYGDPQTDALRRDLTINGLFYDLATFSVIDYVGGIEDLRKGIIRVIGEPEVRFREDPVRMIRAIRHAARTGFEIEEKTLSAIRELNHLIKSASPARVFEELSRELTGAHAVESFELLERCGLLPFLIPPLAERLAEGGEAALETLKRTLLRLDGASLHKIELTQGVVFSALFVGNLPESAIDHSLSEEHQADVRTFWQLSPFPGEEGAPQGSPGAGNSRRIRSSCLERTVDTLLRPLGVSRKERERIPQLLAGRYTLIALFQDGGDQRGILSRSYFHDSLLLLKLTAHDEMLQDCADYWDERATQRGRERPRDTEREGGRRSRGRSRRGGRRRRGGPRGEAA